MTEYFVEPSKVTKALFGKFSAILALRVDVIVGKGNALSQIEVDNEQKKEEVAVDFKG